MSIDRISSFAAAQASSIGSAPTAAQAAGIAARTVAVEVLGRLGSQFLEAASQWPSGEGKPYALAEIAEALSERLGATPLETMELEGALSTLASALASDMAALADGQTLDRLEAALADGGESHAFADATSVARHLEDLASHVAQAR